MTTPKNFFANIAGAAALAAIAAVPLSAPAAAGENSDDIIVISTKAMKQWQAETTRDLNRALERAPFARSVLPNDAIVQVAFTLGEDGRAQDVTVLSGNGNWAARKAARYAVQQLDTLGDVPVMSPQGTPFLANIIFASDVETHEKLAEQLVRSESARIAAAGGEDPYVLLGS
jgi:hypothetical protein